MKSDYTRFKKTMKLALISERPKIAQKQANIDLMKKYIQKTQADMYVFGELFLTGYCCKDEFRNLVEPLDGPSIQSIKTIAKKTKSYIIFGMPLLDNKIDGLIHNTSILVHPNGKVDYYNKWYLPTFGPFEEKIFFDEGEDLPVFTTKFGKVGLFICYDIFFPEIARSMALQGAELLISISATPSPNRKYFEIIIPARALENTVYMVYVNLVGTQEDLVFWGGSQVYDPLGNLLVKAPYFKKSIVTCDIDFKKINIARANRPVIRDIRPQIYDDLYDLARFHCKK